MTSVLTSLKRMLPGEKMKRISYAIVLIMLLQVSYSNAAVNATDRRLAQIESPLRNVFVVQDQKLDKQKIKMAIAAAGAARDWKVVGERDGQTTLTTTIRGKHEMTLQVNYDEKGFDLVYVSSANLMYLEDHGRKLIHHNYNVWIRELATSISKVVGVPATIFIGAKNQARGNSQSGTSIASQQSIPALAASGFAEINNIDAVPVRPEGKPRYEHYLTLKSPKAFAVSETGSWRFVWSNVDASSKVLQSCEERYTKCWLYAVDDRVVWNADPLKRVGTSTPPVTR